MNVQAVDFDARLMRYLDGAMDAAALAAFDAELAGDAGKRASLVTAAMHGRLFTSRLATQMPASWGEAAGEPIVTAEPAGKWTIGRIGLIGGIAAAVLVIGAVGAAYLTMGGDSEPQKGPPAQPTVAVLIDAGDAEWRGEPLTGGQDVSRGPIELGAGSIDLEMLGGASVRLSGPVRATLASRDRIVLERGSLEATLDGGGFAVDVPGGVRVTDIGTAFTVDVGDDGRAMVRVTEGRVRIDRLGSGSSMPTIIAELAAGQRAWVNAEHYSQPMRVVRELAVVNASFEDDGSEMVSDQMPRGWRSVIAGRAGSQDQVTTGNFTAGFDGRFVGLVNHRLVTDEPGVVSAMVQDTDHRIEPGFEYELTVAVGRRLDHDARNAEPTLWAIALCDADTGDVLASADGVLSESGVMSDRTLTYRPSDADAGRRLSIRLLNPQDESAMTRPGQTNYDHVRLVRIEPTIHANPDSPSGNETKETPK